MRVFNTLEEIEAHQARVRAGRGQNAPSAHPASISSRVGAKTSQANSGAAKIQARRGVMAKHESYLFLDLPLKTVSEINRRDSWQARHKRRVAQQKEINIEWKMKLGTQTIWLPCRVTFTRIGAKLLDDDNLRSALKACRDEIARLLCTDDSPTGQVTWEYKQEAIGRHDYRVKIEVESL